MADQVREFFGLRVDFDLGVMRPRQDLEYLTAAVTRAIGDLLDRVRPGRVIVQGDTTTAFLVALAAFYKKIPVAHVEAGLRTGDRYYPFPEEMNRRLIANVADLHFAPTPGARDNLIREGIPRESVFVTGNTGIDALLWARTLIPARYPRLGKIDFSKKVILVTAHRRESLGRPIKEICRAFVDIVRADPDVEIVYPVHLNPRVREVAGKILAGRAGIRLLPPVNYGELVYLMTRCYCILTDSGGIQEEAPSLGKPVLVMRDETERPEGVALGVARLVGRERHAIARETLRLISSPRAYRAMAKGVNPYGDGRAAMRIRRIIEKNI
jgi:UDP-N-acetylglucosamine 2-epimerase (non-hydrolysing)